MKTTLGESFTLTSNVAATNILAVSIVTTFVVSAATGKRDVLSECHMQVQDLDDDAETEAILNDTRLMADLREAEACIRRGAYTEDADLPRE